MELTYEKSILCSYCCSTFSQKSTLARHIRASHGDGKEPVNYVCSECNYSFNYKHNLRRHIETKHTESYQSHHGGLDNLVCHFCDRNFSRIDVVRRHVLSKHMNVVKEERRFVCHHCDKRFVNKSNIRKHIEHFHLSDKKRQRDASSKSSLYTCVLCCKSFPKRLDISNHFESYHHIPLHTEDYSFKNAVDFLSWMTDVEKQLHCTYLKQNFYTGKYESTIIYVCSRRGFYAPTSARKRRPRKQGSKKINGFCPSEIIVRIADDGSHSVRFLKTHVGHSIDSKQLVYVRYSAQEKNVIAEKLVSGVPAPQIVDDLVATEQEKPRENLQKIDLLNSRDVFNIAAVCHLNYSYKHQSEYDGMSIESYIEKNVDSILYYKPQGECCAASPCFSDDDFVLVLMKKVQAKKFKQYSSSVILIDKTYCNSKYEFMVHTVWVFDSFSESYPGCFLICNRDDDLVIDVLFSCIQEKVGLVCPRVFISDMETSYYKSWIRVMTIKPEFHLFPKWHVTRAWFARLGKILPPCKREKVKQQLMQLQQENDVASFHCQLKAFLEKEDDDLQPFLAYFRANYSTNFRSWADCYRQESGISSNFGFDTFHGTVKIRLGKVMKTRQVEKIVHFLDDYVKRKEHSSVLEIVNCGPLPYKIKRLRANHDQAKSLINAFDIEEESCGNSWVMKLPEGDDTKSYTLKWVKESCEPGCRLLCGDCQFCAHQFTCTCSQNSRRGTMCKHIHLLCLTSMQDVIEITEEVECEDDCKDDACFKSD